MLIWSSAMSITNVMMAYCASRPSSLGVAHADVAAVGDDRLADEAREIGAEGEHQQGDDDPGHEQHHAAEQLGHVGQAEPVEGDDQRGQDDQPVDQHAEQPHGVELGRRPAAGSRRCPRAR